MANVCDVCFHAFPAGEGQLGDTCSHCGWEADQVENCVEVAQWSVNHGFCTVDEANHSIRSCLCHISDHCGWSSANGDTLREARARYVSTLDFEGRKARAVRYLLSRRG